jgi:hypothetical protein
MTPAFKTSLATALALTLLTGASLAQSAPEQPPVPDEEQLADYGDGGWHGKRHGHHGRHGGKGRHMMIVDVNSDGIIGEDEAARLADHAFTRMDDDRDGALSESEFVSGPRHGKRWWRGWFSADEAVAVEKVRKDKFAALDTDKNASLSKLEFFAEAKQMLAAADAGKDGKVTPWEFRAAMTGRHP